MPSKISDFASAIASQVSKNSRWAGAMVVTSATCGCTMPTSARNFAEMVHADFEHAVRRVARHGGEAERHAPVIVVGRGRGMRAAQRAEGETQHLLRRRLAGAAGDGDDLRMGARTRSAREIFQPALCIGDRRSGALAGRSDIARCTSAAPAFAASAAFTKSWPSRASPLSATNRSPGFRCAYRWKGP